jgi:hypothetical protein
LTIVLNAIADVFRVRAKIRGSAEGYVISSNYYLTCLYAKTMIDVKRIELGFLRSTLLLQVSTLLDWSS